MGEVLDGEVSPASLLHRGRHKGTAKEDGGSKRRAAVEEAVKSLGVATTCFIGHIGHEVYCA